MSEYAHAMGNSLLQSGFHMFSLLPDNIELIFPSLGDSGFIILRHGRVLYASPAQTHVSLVRNVLRIV